MKAIRYAHSAIFLTFGAIGLGWGVREFYRALTADEHERVVLENALGGGFGPEFFALRFVGIGMLALVVGWFDWCRTTAKKGKRSA